MGYPRVKREAARKLYVEEGGTFEDIAAELGINKGTLLAWANPKPKKGKPPELTWADQREKHYQLRAKLEDAKHAITDEVIRTKDPKLAQALAQLFYAERKREPQQATDANGQSDARPIVDPEEFSQAIFAVVFSKLERKSKVAARALMEIEDRITRGVVTALIDLQVPTVIAAVHDKAAHGDVQAAKLLFDMRERYRPDEDVEFVFSWEE